MFDLSNTIGLGFATALSVENLVFCLLGTLIGTLVGVLPGLGPVATIAMLLPITFKLDPTAAIIMLAGIFYGAQYGGSTTAILVNIPGESSSVVTTLDGHQMAKNGRAGAALAVAALGSFFAGTIATMLVAVIAVPLTRAALLFGPAELFSLMILGLVCAIVLAKGSVLKALAMVVAGLLLSTVGSDLETGQLRMTLGIRELGDGIGFITLAMGFFGFAEIIRNLDRPEVRDVVRGTIGKLWPNREEFRRSVAPTLRGTVIGSVLGILPGSGAVMGPFASYGIEKRISKHPEQFGRGAIEGVAGPESANNAAAQTAFVPLLTLGLPPNAVLALMAGALTIHGIVPGPQVITRNPELFWGLIASMWIGNLMLLIINLPLIGLWVKLLKVPYRLLYPAIILICCIGVYSVNNSVIDVFLAALFGLVGYMLIKLGFEPAPMLLAFVLGPMMEENLRRAILLSRGDVTVFVTQPISATLLFLALAMLIFSLLPMLQKKREKVFAE